MMTNKKNQIFRLRLTPKDRLRMNQMAEMQDISTSELIRQLVEQEYHKYILKPIRE